MRSILAVLARVIALILLSKLIKVKILSSRLSNYSRYYIQKICNSTKVAQPTLGFQLIVISMESSKTNASFLAS